MSRIFPFEPKMLLPLGLSDGLGTLSGSSNMNASTIKVAHMFQAPKSGTLDKFEFRMGSTVTINSGSVVRASFQDVLTTGTAPSPDETQDQFRDIAGSALSASAWIVPGLLTSDGTDTGTKRTVTAGDLLAAVLEFQTFTTGDNIQICNNIVGLTKSAYPIQVRKASGTWSEDLFIFCVLKYSDGSYASPFPRSIPASAANNPSFASNSTPDERGLLFQVPLPYEINALFYRGVPGGASGDYNLVLYDHTDTAVATVSADATIVGRSARGAYHILSSRVVLTPNSNYRLILKPTTTNSVTLVDFDFASEAIKNAVADSTWKYTQRTDAGAWTDTATKLPWTMGIELSGISL